MKSLVFRTLLVFCGVVLISVAASFGVVNPVYANDYSDCVDDGVNEQAPRTPTGQLTEIQLLQIETMCHQRFPDQSTAAATAPSTRRTTTSRQTSAPRVNTSSSAPASTTSPTPTTTSPAPTTSSSPTASSTPSPISTSSSTPSPQDSASPSNSSDPQPVPSSTSGSSSSSNDSRSGPTQPSMFSDHSDPNSVFRTPPTGANTDGANLDQYAQPLLRIGDRQLAFQILVNFFLGIISVVALLFLVFNSYRYAMARGEDSQIGQAKKGITYSIIGLILVLAAYTIVATVLNFGAQSSL